MPEALALGLASGSACLASCGVVLLPWITALRRGWRGSAALLALFLGGRLAGYLIIGLAAGLAGSLMDLKGPKGLLLGGIADLGAAALLAYQAWRGHRDRECPVGQGGRLERRFGMAGLGLLGLLTGLNLCGPFVVGILKAAGTGSPVRAMGFFGLFFLGTAVWMLPLLGAGALRRWPPLAQVSRLMLGLLSIYYTYNGVILLLARWKHV